MKKKIKNILVSILPVVFYEKLYALRNLGYWPNIKKPRTFNEKILHRKIFGDQSLYACLADKWAVRSYVEKKVGVGILNKIYFVGNNPQDIPYETLPSQFIIKFTHSAGFNIIVKDKEKINIEEIEINCHRELKRRLGKETNEPWYLEIEPQIIIEELLEDSIYEIPLDYKFFVFHGICKAIQVDIGRFGHHKRSMLDPNWKPLPFQLNPDIAVSNIIPKKPDLLNEMIRVAEKISEDFDFCRLDLYCPNDAFIRFGEMTFSPAAGTSKFCPKEYDLQFGLNWHQE